MSRQVLMTEKLGWPAEAMRQTPRNGCHHNVTPCASEPKLAFVSPVEAMSSAGRFARSSTRCNIEQRAVEETVEKDCRHAALSGTFMAKSPGIMFARGSPGLRYEWRARQDSNLQHPDPKSAQRRFHTVTRIAVQLHPIAYHPSQHGSIGRCTLRRGVSASACHGVKSSAIVAKLFTKQIGTNRQKADILIRIRMAKKRASAPCATGARHTTPRSRLRCEWTPEAGSCRMPVGAGRTGRWQANRLRR